MLGSRKQEAGSRKQEAGNRKQEAGNRLYKTRCTRLVYCNKKLTPTTTGDQAEAPTIVGVKFFISFKVYCKLKTIEYFGFYLLY